MSNSEHIKPSPSDSYNETVQRIEHQRVIPLLTGKSAEHIFQAAKELSENSECLIGVDLGTQGVKDKLKSLKRKGERVFGAFSVRSAKEARTAASSGAVLIFSPHLDKRIVRRCKTEHVFHAPGALTPNEVSSCTELRADAVSIFPCSAMGGVVWLKTLMDMFPGVKFIPTDKMTPADAGNYLNAGAFAVAPIINVENMQKNEGFLVDFPKSAK